MTRDMRLIDDKSYAAISRGLPRSLVGERDLAVLEEKLVKMANLKSTSHKEKSKCWRSVATLREMGRNSFMVSCYYIKDGEPSREKIIAQHGSVLEYVEDIFQRAKSGESFLKGKSAFEEEYESVAS